MTKRTTFNEVSTSTLGMKAGKGSVAPTVTKLQPGEIEERVYKTMVCNVLTQSYLPNVVKLATWIHYWSGCRISELIRLKQSDFKHAGMIYIRALKGSDSRIVNIPVCPFVNENVRLFEHELGEVYSRFYFYRLYKSVGLSAYYGKNKMASVTHIMRHNYALKALDLSNSGETSSRAIGHKNTKNIKYYEKKERSTGKNKIINIK